MEVDLLECHEANNCDDIKGSIAFMNGTLKLKSDKIKQKNKWTEN